MAKSQVLPGREVRDLARVGPRPPGLVLRRRRGINQDDFSQELATARRPADCFELS
jgi:hypothetical protein